MRGRSPYVIITNNPTTDARWGHFKRPFWGQCKRPLRLPSLRGGLPGLLLGLAGSADRLIALVAASCPCELEITSTSSTGLLGQGGSEPALRSRHARGRQSACATPARL